MLVRIMGFRFMVFSFPHSGSTLPCLPEAAGLGAPLCSCCWAGGTAPGWCWAACCPWQFPAPTAGLLLAMAAQGPERGGGTRPARRTSGRATPERGLPGRALPPPTADKMADCAEVTASPSGAEPTNPRGGARRRQAGAGEEGKRLGRPLPPGLGPFPPPRFLLPTPAPSQSPGGGNRPAACSPLSLRSRRESRCPSPEAAPSRAAP